MIACVRPHCYEAMEPFGGSWVRRVLRRTGGDAEQSRRRFACRSRRPLCWNDSPNRLWFRGVFMTTRSLPGVRRALRLIGLVLLAIAPGGIIFIGRSKLPVRSVDPAVRAQALREAKNLTPSGIDAGAR